MSLFKFVWVLDTNPGPIMMRRESSESKDNEPFFWSGGFLLKRRMRRIASEYGISVCHLALVYGKIAYHDQVRI